MFQSGFVPLALGTVLLAVPVDAAAVGGQSQPGGVLWAVAGAGTLGAALAACPVQGVRPLREQSRPMRAAFTTGAVIATPVYALLKSAVAVALSGSAAWMAMLTFDLEAARTVLRAGWAGDWRLRPGHATCEEPVRLLVAPRPVLQ